jgi:hypothetical protein
VYIACVLQRTIPFDVEMSILLGQPHCIQLKDVNNSCHLLQHVAESQSLYRANTLLSKRANADAY